MGLRVAATALPSFSLLYIAGPVEPASSSPLGVRFPGIGRVSEGFVKLGFKGWRLGSFVAKRAQSVGFKRVIGIIMSIYP